MDDGLKGFFRRVEAEPSAEFTEELLARLRVEFEADEFEVDEPGRLGPGRPGSEGDASPGPSDDAEPVVVALTMTEGRGDHGKGTSRPIGRRRWVPVAAAAAAAVVVVAASTALLVTRDRGNDGEQNVDAVDERPGLPPTVERLQGIWLEDPGTGTIAAPLMARFEPDGRFALGGVLAEDSWTYGTYEVEGHTITFTVTEGRCNSRDVFTWDAEILSEGRLKGVHAGADGDRPEQLGTCIVPVGEPRDFTRISPTSPAADAVSPSDHVEGPLTNETRMVDLQGFWLMAATGHLLRVDPSGGYLLDDGGELATSPDDAGTLATGSATLTFTTGSRADECTEGDTMVWSNVRVEDGRLRGLVDEDSCGRGLPGEVTLLFLEVDSP